ncbi:hypothetical protein PH586_21740 [Pseudomonas sp. SA3-5]|uniref:Phage infection protein n=1 Tax=Pseudomonas aestuarii TaxID=3018340 RepID=A0ABT4XL98_9PSED|nr:hypothetical protein [Pseudomonas aestuarii]MDA7089006.1 hypothetical protein [Pseudomonas aestuarii]
MKKPILASLTLAGLLLASLSVSAFVLPQDIGQVDKTARLYSEGGADRTGVNRVAEGGAERTAANRTV